MILMLEWVAGRIPRGTHDWRMFIKPKEIQEHLVRSGLEHLEHGGISIRSLRLERFNIVPSFRISKTNFSGVYVGAARKS
jgi:2-polyprenyl-3-methyl-5-hydroxy-6-metoxy-1,4-benzoquinol methylase